MKNISVFIGVAIYYSPMSFVNECCDYENKSVQFLELDIPANQS